MFTHSYCVPCSTLSYIYIQANTPNLQWQTLTTIHNMPLTNTNYLDFLFTKAKKKKKKLPNRNQN